MSEVAAELIVDVNARETVSAVLARLETQLSSTNSSVEKIATTMQARLGGAQQRAASDALAHAQAQARLQVASGDTAGAIRTMQAALQGIPAGTTAAIRGETQLVQLQTKLAKETQGTSQFVDAFKQGLFGLVAPAAAAGTALSVLRSVISEAEAGFKLKASLDADTKAIQIQLAGVRDSGVAFQQAAQYAAQYKLTQQQTTEAISAAIPVITHSSASMQTILGTFDQLRVRSPEKSFSDAARALGELQAGQYTSLNKIFNVPIEDARRLSDEIKKGGDAVQLVSQYLTSVGAGMDVVAARATGAAGAMKDLDIASEQLKLALGDDATGPGLLILQTRVRATQGLINLLRGDTAGMAQGLKDAGTSFAASAIGASAYATALASGKSAAEAQAAANAAAAAATNSLTAAQVVGSGGGGTWATAQEQAAAAVQAATAAVQQHTAEIQANAQAAVLAAAEQTAQKAATDQLTASTTQAVDAFLALYPTIDAAGIASAVAAGKIPPLIGQLAQLRVAAYSARDAIAALAAEQGLHTQKLVGDVGIGAPAITSGRNNSVDAVVALQAANKKAADDQIAGDLAIAKAKGDTARQIAILRQQQQGLNKDSLAYKQIEADIIGLEKPKKTKGAGAPKLSDQQKLNNSLLADQDAADNKYEDAERNHQQRLLDIQAEFAKKSLEQQKANEISKRQSQADFYDRLTSSDLNKSKDKGDQAALKKIDADYQAAFAKAQEIAQAGNAKLAADYLAFKQKQAEAELAYAEQVAKAKADKDKAELNRLEQIHKLRQDAAAEEEKQLLEGGDANVNARDQAIQDESTKYADSQDKIALAAERSADRQIAAADRAGKKIDEQALKADKLAKTYDRIAPNRGQPATGAADTPAGADAAASVTPPADPAAALEEAKAAIVDAINKNTGATKAVENAVRSLGERFGR